MLAWIKDLKQIESNDIQHTYPGSYGRDCLLTETSVDISKVDGTSKVQIKCVSLKDRSILFKKQYISHVVEIGKDKFLATDRDTGLIVIDWEVTGKVENPDELWMNYPFTVPNFDLDTFPFVIVNYAFGKISLINVKEKTI